MRQFKTMDAYLFLEDVEMFLLPTVVPANKLTLCQTVSWKIEIKEKVKPEWPLPWKMIAATKSRQKDKRRFVPNLPRIDDYAEDGGPGEVWLLCSFYHESLCTRIKTIVNKFAISNHTALILGVHALRNYLSLICEYELHSLPNKKVSGAKDHGKSTSRSDRPWSAIFCIIVYWIKLNNAPLAQHQSETV